MRLSSGSANYVAPSSTNTIVTGKGNVFSLVATAVPGASTNIQTVTLYDNTSAAGTVLGVFAVTLYSPLVIHWPRCGLSFVTGLTAITTQYCAAHLVVES